MSEQPEQPRKKGSPENRSPQGSPSPGEPSYLVVGKFRRPHGVSGEILFDVYSDFPERLKAGKKIFVGEDRQVLRIRRSRAHGQALLLGFQQYTTPEEVSELTNQLAYVSVEDLPALPEGEYYHHQLLGLRVQTDTGANLGQLVQILENPANDIYIVQPERGKEILLPAIEDVILDIDLEAKMMRVHLLPGLLPDE